MNNRHFNCIFRPLVNRAWIEHSKLTGVPPNNKTAKDRWYRDTLNSCAGIYSTKDATDKQQKAIIHTFTMLSQGCDNSLIQGWTDPQNARFNELAAKAWEKQQTAFSGTYQVWLNQLLESCSIYKRTAGDCKESFDNAMAALAVIAMDMYWINRTAEAAERRMRWQIERYMSDLEHLEKVSVDWDYIRGIWEQSQLLPADIMDAPAEILQKLLAMLDTHIRRLCKDYGIRPMELPSRAHPHLKPIPIREENKHIHVGHELEHCAPVHAETEELPF